MDEFTALFSRKDMTFEEAVAYFKERVPVTASRFYQIAAEYRALAFTVSGYTKAQVLKKFYDELLAALEDMGLPRIVASSSPRNMIEMNLQTTGTARYFHDIVCGNEVKLCKPAPDIFLEAARRIKVDIHDCMVLEDSHNGIRAGHASGAETVMVPDLLPVTDEMRSLYDDCCKDLFEVKAKMEQGVL